MKKLIRHLLIIVFWLLVWQLTATVINKPVLFASFTSSITALFRMMTEKQFYLSIARTFCFTFIGLGVSYFLAILSGFISYRFPFILQMLSPLLTLMKAIPVASFAILVIIWFSNEMLSIFVGFVVVFPQIYFATLNGLENTDKGLLELANVFRISAFNRYFYIYRTAIAPYVYSASQSAISMGIKSAIAAEVIGTTTQTIGQQLYYSKIYLDTAELFSWTFVIILLSLVTEKALLKLIRKIGGKYDDQN